MKLKENKAGQFRTAPPPKVDSRTAEQKAKAEEMLLFMQAMSAGLHNPKGGY